MTFKRSLAAVAAVAVAFPALAHESRVLPASTGNVRVTVGFLGEPAFEDTYNGLDLFLYTFDGRCPVDTSDFFGNPIDNSAAGGDTIDIHAEALYLNASAPPTGTHGNQPPTGAFILKKLEITKKSPIGGVFGDPGHYNSWFRPTHPTTMSGAQSRPRRPATHATRILPHPRQRPFPQGRRLSILIGSVRRRSRMEIPNRGAILIASSRSRPFLALRPMVISKTMGAVPVTKTES